MSGKIDERLPRDIGEGALPNHASVKTPWDKLISLHDAANYASRYGAVIGAALMQALRILVPDYVERTTAMCKNAYERLTQAFRSGIAPYSMDMLNIHPFCRGNFVGGLNGDNGDEGLLMCGRVNDFGSYRVEKELDRCDWDIIGTELCRATVLSLQGVADVEAEYLRPGPHLEYHMVEAKGNGELHCRIVAECRKKYPMPETEIWKRIGPVATGDQIKFTPEEDILKEPMVFREECDYKYISGLCTEQNAASNVYPIVTMSNGSTYILPVIYDLIKKGKLEEKFVDHVIKCVCEASGKAAFGEFYAKEGLRDWLGAPKDMNDGRLMGAHIEMILKCLRISYEIESFNKEEVIYVIDRNALANNMPKMVNAYISTWYGMTKTLVNAQWALWEEVDNTPGEKLRIKIAKRIDKFS
ncbi:hypothetical protein [Alkalibacter mobilis]|uniref:hypothetical protein n=1 Tax=Alkalibacter mobilis TaxID=2787712 RepID=UPI00189D1FF3|nr:hypothetical protein [Alkalibacter mobilis]MBF7097694.1 hypothetical protein [Alkalibacter mobilis]